MKETYTNILCLLKWEVRNWLDKKNDIQLYVNVDSIWAYIHIEWTVNPILIL